MDCSKPGFCVLHCLSEFVQTHFSCVDDAIEPSHPLSSASPPALSCPASGFFSNELALGIGWPKYWSVSFKISLSNEFLGLISFRIDCPAFLAVQGTLKSLLQHQSLKTSILRCSVFFMIQLSHLYMTTGKSIALTVWNFDSRLCLCFLICCLGWS